MERVPWQHVGRADHPDVRLVGAKAVLEPLTTALPPWQSVQPSTTPGRHDGAVVESACALRNGNLRSPPTCPVHRPPSGRIGAAGALTAAWAASFGPSECASASCMPRNIHRTASAPPSKNSFRNR